MGQPFRPPTFWKGRGGSLARTGSHRGYRSMTILSQLGGAGDSWPRWPLETHHFQCPWDDSCHLVLCHWCQIGTITKNILSGYYCISDKYCDESLCEPTEGQRVTMMSLIRNVTFSSLLVTLVASLAGIHVWTDLGLDSFDASWYYVWIYDIMQTPRPGPPTNAAIMFYVKHKRALGLEHMFPFELQLCRVDWLAKCPLMAFHVRPSLLTRPIKRSYMVLYLTQPHMFWYSVTAMWQRTV